MGTSGGSRRRNARDRSGKQVVRWRIVVAMGRAISGSRGWRLSVAVPLEGTPDRQAFALRVRDCQTNGTMSDFQAIPAEEGGAAGYRILRTRGSRSGALSLPDYHKGLFKGKTNWNWDCVRFSSRTPHGKAAIATPIDQRARACRSNCPHLPGDRAELAIAAMAALPNATVETREGQRNKATVNPANSLGREET